MDERAARKMESVKIRECRDEGRIPMKRGRKRIPGIYRAVQTFHKLYFQIDLFRVSNKD